MTHLYTFYRLLNEISFPAVGSAFFVIFKSNNESRVINIGNENPILGLSELHVLSVKVILGPNNLAA